MTEVCENIGPAQRRRRVRISVIAFVVAAVLAALLVILGASRLWRVVVLPPLWVGVLAFLEARMRTCVVLAALGVRNMDTGNQAIADTDLRRALVRRARGVHVRTAAVTIVLTALFVAL